MTLTICKHLKAPLTNSEQKASNGVDVRVYVPIGKKEQGTFGLDVAVKVLPLLEEYFGQKYPLPKLDLVAIPDFSAGAMENWGLVTYRETALLVDPVNSSAHSKQWVALVVAHEVRQHYAANNSRSVINGSVTWLLWNGGKTYG